YDNAERAVRYEYDGGGRLSRVTGADGIVRRYTYTDRDQMSRIVEPEMTIENTYDTDGRCIRQVDTFPDDAEPLTFDFKYRVEGNEVVQAESTRSDGTWSRYTFKGRYSTSETWGATGTERASFTYERDPVTNIVTSLTVTCPDRTGRPLRHSSIVRPGDEDRIKWDLLQTHCSWNRPRER